MMWVSVPAFLPFTALLPKLCRVPGSTLYDATVNLVGESLAEPGWSPPAW